MRLLLDECVPKELRRHLQGHNSVTVTAAGWSGIRNGRLLGLGAGAGFQALITTDRGYEHQQNPATLPLPVVILRARSNAMPDVLPLVPQLIKVLTGLSQGVTIIDY
jgi:hypothetical protein